MGHKGGRQGAGHTIGGAGLESTKHEHHLLTLSSRERSSKCACPQNSLRSAINSLRRAPKSLLLCKKFPLLHRGMMASQKLAEFFPLLQGILLSARNGRDGPLPALLITPPRLP